jgi:lysozyme family protein
MKTNPAGFFKNTILVHESARHSVDPDDRGNWHGGRMVGSKYGVTGDALARHRGVARVTRQDMAALGEAEAIALGLKGYYHTNGIDKLPWDAVIAGVVDLGFNAGPGAAVKVLQRLIGTGADGQAGDGTKRAYEKWRAARTEEKAMIDWTSARIAFYVGLKNPKYINGWTNRARSFVPGGSWWKANVG